MFVSITDWIIQGFLVLNIVVLPFFFKPGKGSRLIGYPVRLRFAFAAFPAGYAAMGGTNYRS